MKKLFSRNEITPATEDMSSRCITLNYDGWLLELTVESKENYLVYRQFHECDKAETVNHLLAKVYSDLRALATSKNPTLAHKWVIQTAEYQAVLRLAKQFLNAQVA